MEAAGGIARPARAASGSRLAPGELLACGGALALLLAMLLLEWFAYEVEGRVIPGSGGDAFRWLDGTDVIILLCALGASGALLLRAAGIVTAGAREVAVATGAAGLLATMLVAATLMSPPGLDPSVLNPLAGANGVVRPGAVAGLLAALAILAGSAMTVVRTAVGRTPAAAPVSPIASPPVVEPAPPTAPAVEPTPPPKSKPAAKRKPGPKRKPPAKRQSAPPAKLSLAKASAKDLMAVGFTETQAKRIVSYRDKEAIVTKVADLRRVPGIAKPVLAKLIERLDD